MCLRHSASNFSHSPPTYSPFIIVVSSLTFLLCLSVLNLLKKMKKIPLCSNEEYKVSSVRCCQLELYFEILAQCQCLGSSVLSTNCRKTAGFAYVLDNLCKILQDGASCVCAYASGGLGFVVELNCTNFLIC